MEHDDRPVEPTDESDVEVIPSAMPLSMPPMGPAMSATPAADPETVAPDTPAEVPTVPVSAMPLSMPPVGGVGPDPVTAEYPTSSGTGGAGVPPGGFSWPSEAWPPPSDPSVADAPPRRSHRGAAILLGATLLAGGLGAGLGVGLSSSSPAGGGNALSGTTASTPKALSAEAIYKLVSPAVVDIDTVVSTPSSDGGNGAAAGTGMIVSSNGIILTNNHVIKDALRIDVTIVGRSGQYPATVLGTSVNNDIALIKVNGLTDLPTVTFGNSATLQVGATALAVGNAEGLGGSPSAATGSISALGRTINASEEGNLASSETLHNLIETNAQIQPGDSGGPLLNSAGQVIGMDTAAESGDTGVDLGFAIPINFAKTIALSIEQGKVTASNGVHVGLSPYFGIFVPTSGTGASTGNGNGFGFSVGNSGACDTTPTQSPAGASVSDVATGGPAALAGITGGDTITAVNGKAVTDSTISPVIAGLSPRGKVSVAYADTCGAMHTTTITVGSIPA